MARRAWGLIWGSPPGVTLIIKLFQWLGQYYWRRGRDSNPRYGFPHTHFPGVRLQPLGHPSAACTEAHAVFKEGTRAAGALCAFSHSATPPQHAPGRTRSSRRGRTPQARCAPSATRPPLRSMRRGANRRSSGVWSALAPRRPNRTCAGHKPSGPSRQAAKRSPWRRLRFFPCTARREAARNRAEGGAFRLYCPCRRASS